MGIEITSTNHPAPAYQVHYDDQNRVIFIEYAAKIILTEEVFSAAIKDIAKISQTLSNKVWLLSNMNGASVDPKLQQNYEKYYTTTLLHVRGILRYNVTNLLTQVTIRSATVTSHLQQNKSHIYPNKEAALQAVRLMEQLEKLD
jgi:hypothetical protein